MSNDRHYIGGGNTAGILGVSPYKTPLQEYLTITGQAEEADAERLSFFRRRKSFEPVAAELFEERTGLRLVRVNERFTDREYSFIKAEIDAETKDANVEIKTCHPMAARDWGDEGEDNCPVYVTAQAQHGLMVTGRELCYVLAMIGFDDVRVYQVRRDEEIIAAIRDREVSFWREHVERLIPPDASNAVDLGLLYRHDSGNSVEATEQIARRIDDLRIRNATIRALQEESDADKEAIQLFMANAAAVTIGGRPACTWKSQSSKRLNQAAFKAAHPDLFEQFKTESATRVFRTR